MDFSKCCNKYTDPRSIKIIEEKVSCYNWIKDHKQLWDIPGVNIVFPEYFFNSLCKEDMSYEDCIYIAFMEIISNCPMGAELFVHVKTNYEQLATIYRQRKNHKLKEDYGAFVDMVKSLPYSKELIIGNYDDV